MTSSSSRPSESRDRLARAALADLSDPSPWILLHGEAALMGDGELSDVDCALEAADPDRLQRQLAEMPGHLRLVAVWPYDCRGLGLFLATADLTHVVHLDLLADPDGIGAYGIRTHVLAAGATDAGSHPWRRPDRLDQLLYLLSKRTRKGQDERVRALVDELAGQDPARVTARADDLLTPVARTRVSRALGTAPARWSSRAAMRLRRAAEETRRRLRRLRHPIGAWVHVVDAGGGPELAIPTHAGVLRRAPAPSGLSSRLRLVAVRWRRGVTVTAGPRPERGASANLDSAAIEDVQAWMSAHAERSLRRHG